MTDKKLVANLRNLVMLNEATHGGPYQGAAAEACVQAMAEAAERIEVLASRIDSALMAYAETRDDDESRCRAMAAHLHEE